MDITGLDIAGLCAGLGAFLKSLHSDSKTKAISDDRKRSKENYEARFVALKARLASAEKRLDEGSNEFRVLAEEMKTNNALLNQLLGALKAKGYNVG